MGNALQDNAVVAVGRGSGIARAVAMLVRDEDAHVIVTDTALFAMTNRFLTSVTLKNRRR